MLLAVLLALGASAGSPPPSAMDSRSAALAENVESASRVLLSGSQMSREAIQGALADLLESASRLAEKDGLPAPARDALASAADVFAGGGFLEPDTYAAVERAYRALTGGRPFAFPETVDSIPAAREHGRAQLQRAREALEAGRSKEAIREVVALVLLVTTPMERQ